MTRTVCLVACVTKKGAVRAQARDLYVSPWFRKARQFAEATEGPWFILSAKHGLVRPDVWLEPYEWTLHRMAATERRAWAAGVLGALRRVAHDGDRVVVLAGQRYPEHLMSGLRAIFTDIDVPLAGMRIGEQLRWLTRRTEARWDGSRT